MEHKDLFYYVLIGVLLGLVYLSFLLIRPFLTAFVLGLILAYMLYPLYQRLDKRLRQPNLSSIIMVTIAAAVVILPSIYIGVSLVRQSVDAYNSLHTLNVSQLPPQVFVWSGLDSETAVSQIDSTLRSYIVTQGPRVLGNVADILAMVFLLFFVMFFAFRDGESWYRSIRRGFPMERRHKDRLFERLGSVTSAVVYGQVLTAIVQGIAGGLMFWIFGLPAPVFWGFVMMILSFVPYVGTAIVWLPVGIFQISQGNYVAGIGVLLVGGIIVSNIDNVLRPYLIGTRSELSLLLVLTGVLGGLKLFGFIGILLGPLLLAMLKTVFSIYMEASEERQAKVEKARTDTEK